MQEQFSQKFCLNKQQQLLCVKIIKKFNYTLNIKKCKQKQKPNSNSNQWKFHKIFFITQENCVRIISFWKPVIVALNKGILGIGKVQEALNNAWFGHYMYGSVN